MRNKHRYNHFYICGVYLEEGDVTPIAYKLGITSYDPTEYNSKRLGFHHKVIYSFQTTKFNSKKIELVLKRNIQCGYLGKEFYGAGHTETIKPSQLPEVVNLVISLCDYDNE